MKTELPAICQRIAQLPEKLGITEYEFARTIGKPQSVIQNITVRGHKPGYDIIKRICRHHQISAEWLILGKLPIQYPPKRHINDTGTHSKSAKPAIQ